MSVLLEDVTKAVKLQGKPHLLFDKLNLEIGRTSRIGILALPKSGKSTLLGMICGTARPDSGRIQKDLSVSWPIPSGSFIVPSSSVAWNIRSLARIYGVKNPDFVHSVGELGGLTNFLSQPVSRCPPYVKGQLAFALGIAMEFELYLFDNTIVPQRKEFKLQAVESLRQRTEGKAILFVTSAAQAVTEFCDSIYVLEQGRATHFPEASEGVEYFKALQKAEAERQSAIAADRKPEDATPDSTAGDDDQNVEMATALLSDF
ncbi:MAG TPA: hypothetical protein VII49_14370 [Rhizomicrobium sp.]